VDLDKSIVIDILEDRKKSFLEKYFNNLGTNFCEQIKVLSCDMWDGFANLAGTLFPNAELVIDRFHFFKNLNKQLDYFRKHLKKTLFNDLELHQGKLRFALLKASEKLSNEDHELLEAAFEVSLDLKIFYNLREELRNIFNQKLSIKDAIEKTTLWKQQVQNFDNKYLNKFLKTFNNWNEGILNYFKERISNGVVEGKNNKIKMIKRRAFGFLNFDNMRLRILDEC